nr:hypothetical protein [Xanthomonas phaseoli pv. phaseoli]MDM4806635.1 hypothetical protein [Xanthomonas phaseoli pv. phaseoli]
FFTSNLLGVGNWTPNCGATQNRGDVAGWRLTVNGSFDGRMLSYPDILASRLATLRAIAESVELRPMDAANIECSYQEKARREVCRYRLAP